MPDYMVVDAHEDIAYNAISLHRDFLKDISILRQSLPTSGEASLTPTVSLSEFQRGNVRLVFATIWVAPCGSELASEGPCYSSPDEAYAQANEQLNYYKTLERLDHIRIIKTKAQLRDHLSSETSRKVGFVILMEGADPIRTPSEAKEWFSSGVRIVGPAWQRTRYSGGTRAPGPLSPEGRELMREMENAGLILDISHMAEESFFEALDLFHGCVIASHSNCRVYTPTDRQLSDEMIRAIVDRNGVIGTVLYDKFLDPDWEKRGKLKNDVNLATVAKHMKHVCDLAGDKLHAGIGSDFDGGFGAESIPYELDTAADLQKLGPALSSCGFSERDVANVLGRNWIRTLDRALPD
jgi:membrane dipeptidase